MENREKVKVERGKPDRVPGRFEDLIVWQKAREMAGLVYEATNGDRFARDFGLRDQIRRATVSVMSNIAEGFERGGAPDFARFLLIAKGSCGEVRSQLYLARDQEYLDRDAFDHIVALAEEVSRMLQGLIKRVRERVAPR